MDKEYTQFNEEAKGIKDEYITNQKSILKNEVNGALTILYEKSETK
jgi:hypothetical protein